jgi:hypothetical protein
MSSHILLRFGPLLRRTLFEVSFFCAFITRHASFTPMRSVNSVPFLLHRVRLSLFCSTYLTLIKCFNYVHMLLTLPPTSLLSSPKTCINHFRSSPSCKQLIFSISVLIVPLLYSPSFYIFTDSLFLYLLSRLPQLMCIRFSSYLS